MDRRSYLATVGGTIAATALAGCSSDVGIETVIDPDPSNTEEGLAPNPQDIAEMEVNEEDFEIINTEGYKIERIPLDIAVYWYHTQKARFIDTRTRRQFDQAHIEGALHSPPRQTERNIIDEFGEHERVVTYCTCPHHLSGLRAGELREKNISAYGLEPGFEPWVRQGHPTVMVNEPNEAIRNHDEDYSHVE